MAREDDGPAETIKASHDVMELVRGNSVLSHLVSYGCAKAVCVA
jgi:hypothetical protein